MNSKLRNLGLVVLAVLVATAVFLCLRKPEPVSAERYIETDRLFRDVEANVRGHGELDVIVDIDHSRLGSEAGSPMPPSHVLIFSDPSLDAAIIENNIVAAIDLPFRVLAYEDQESGSAKVIANSYEFISKRHALSDDDALRSRYNATIALAMEGIPLERIDRFRSDTMPDPGLVTLESPYNFDETVQRVTAAIDAQGDTVIFGTIDFAERSAEHSAFTPPLRMILFGGPGPGGKAMVDAPTMGLDAFCQKLLIWQADDKTVRVTFNDLLALAERQDANYGLPLRIINRRLTKTFTTALKE